MWGFTLAHYFKCPLKYTQIAVWVLRFWVLKTSFNKGSNGSVTVPTANFSGSNTEHLMAAETWLLENNVYTYIKCSALPPDNRYGTIYGSGNFA